MRIRPLHDWAIVKISEPEEKTTAGIIIPEIARDEPTEGIVVAIGPGRSRVLKGKLKFTPTMLKPGQRVSFLKHMVQEVEIGTEVITLIREDDVLGTYEEESPIIERKSFEIEIKHKRPLALQEKTKEVPSVAMHKKKTVKAEAVKKEKVVSKTDKPSLKAKAKKSTAKVAKKTLTAKKKAKTSSEKPLKKKTAIKKGTKAKTTAARKETVKKKRALVIRKKLKNK